MSKDEFYARLAAAIGRPLSGLESELLDIACEPKAHGKRRLETATRPEHLEELRGRIPEFIPLEDVASRAAAGAYGYWLFDRKTQTWLIGLSGGTHELLAGVLYGVLQGDEDAVFEHEESAEKYINECCGFFVSGAMNLCVPIKAERYVLEGQERIFEKLKGQLDWRSL